MFRDGDVCDSDAEASSAGNAGGAYVRASGNRMPIMPSDPSFQGKEEALIILQLVCWVLEA